MQKLNIDNGNEQLHQKLFLSTYCFRKLLTFQFSSHKKSDKSLYFTSPLLGIIKNFSCKQVKMRSDLYTEMLLPLPTTATIIVIKNQRDFL